METILITGASGNLGRAVVERLHEAGYSLLATVGKEADQATFAHLPQVNTQVLNVLDAGLVKAFLAENQPESLRAAVLLVGGFATGGFIDTDLAALQKMYDLNFVSAFNVVKPLMAHFAGRGGGQFVLIGARPALNPADGKGAIAYSLSKTLVLALADLINAAGKPDQITATVVVPSVLDTPANRASMPTTDPTNWVPTENVADLIRFLLTDTGRMVRETVVKVYNRS